MYVEFGIECHKLTKKNTGWSKAGMHALNKKIIYMQMGT